MKTLDKKRPYGTVCGVLSETPSVRYEQDGLVFDNNGNQVGAEPEPITEPKPEPVVEVKKTRKRRTVKDLGEAY